MARADADFLLAPVFGAHYDAEETAVVTYIKPSLPAVRDWIAPVLYVTHGEASAHAVPIPPPPSAMRVTPSGGEVLATTTLPYRGGRGTRDDQAWASIHTSPPWEDTAQPAIIEHVFGKGRAIYSVADFERDGASSEPASRAVRRADPYSFGRPKRVRGGGASRRVGDGLRRSRRVTRSGVSFESRLSLSGAADPDGAISPGGAEGVEVYELV